MEKQLNLRLYCRALESTELHRIFFKSWECLFKSLNSFTFLLPDAILEKISEAGFEVAYQKELTLTKEQAAEFYKEHKDKDFYDSLTSHMSRYIHAATHMHTVEMGPSYSLR